MDNLTKNNMRKIDEAKFVRDAQIGTCITILVIGLVIFLIQVRGYGPAQPLPHWYIIETFTIVFGAVLSMLFPVPQIA
jgi:hypothetical protein